MAESNRPYRLHFLPFPRFRAAEEGSTTLNHLVLQSLLLSLNPITHEVRALVRREVCRDSLRGCVFSGGLQSAWNLQWNAPFASPSQLQSSTTPMQQYPGDQSSLLAGQVSSFPISALPGAGPSSEKKGIGRPRDFVWTLWVKSY